MYQCRGPPKFSSLGVRTRRTPATARRVSIGGRRAILVIPEARFKHGDIMKNHEDPSGGGLGGSHTSTRCLFTTPLSVEEAGKQAVVETTMGNFVIEFLPDVAPNHVGYFLKLASEGAYDGTTFHRVIKYGIIQGGDPISKDPEARARYGTGGLGVLESEFNEEQHTRGAVSAVRIPGKPTVQARNSSFALPISSPSTASTPCSVASLRAWTWCRPSRKCPPMRRL